MHNIINRLTKNAKHAIKQSQKISRQTDLKKIDSAYLAKSILEQKGSLGENLLISFKIDKIKVDRAISNINASEPEVSVYDVVLKAFRLALISKNPYVGTEHLFYGLLSIPGQAEKYLSKQMAEQYKNSTPNLPTLLSSKNQLPGDFFGEINMLIENFFNPTKEKGKKPSFLQSYCTNLNEIVTSEDHSLIGREEELERISNVLGRKIKNNPVLIGDPGVGKTAIVEGLALQIVGGKAPFYLSNKRILSLDLGSLIAGTTFRGEFEARLKEIISEAKRDPNVILFIDEIHNLVGAGNAIGGMDAANLLKPALSRGEIQVIGATTYDEYRKYIEKDAALERRFQPIYITEPSSSEAITILKGIKKSYEAYHNITISERALEEAVQLGKRYLPDRFLPDSAIDLIDETAARIRARYSNSKIFQDIKTTQSQLNNIIQQKEALVINDRYEEAIKLRDYEKNLFHRLEDLKKKQREYESQHPITLEEQDIHVTVSQITKVPLSLLASENSTILSRVKSNLQKNLIGQPEVSQKIVQTLLRQFSGIGNPARPLGSFLFIGPTGVGKTLAARLLSQSLSPKASNNSLIQINMSEFMERHTVSRLLGAPAGYVGYEESGELAEKVRRNPYSVILFDEVEKADPAVLNILLQILEDGLITDAKGRQINFKNTIIILTSNIGTTELNQVSKLGFDCSTGKVSSKGEVCKPKKISEKEKATKDAILEELKEQMPLELINRLDHILIFNSLTKQDIEKITRNELQKVAFRLKEKKISLKFSPSAIAFIANKCLDPQQGARLVRKRIEDFVEPLLAEKLLSNSKQKQLTISEKNGSLLVK